MTIGSRIAQIRKERGLSQEAFGESLGVTRQSISKWEADLSIPDVDKLLAINKLYGASIGWILGEEKEKEDGELTEEQLKMVEKIAEKYISAFSKTVQESDHIKQQETDSGREGEPEKSRKNTISLPIWLEIVIIVVVIGMISFFVQLKDQVSSLQANFAAMQRNVDGQIDGITEQVEKLLGDQNSLVADFGYEMESIDLQNGTIVYQAYAVPKTYTEGMLLDFVFETEEKTYQIEGTRGQNNKYSCTIEMPETDWVELSIIIKKDGTEQTQRLEGFDGTKWSGRVSTGGYSMGTELTEDIINLNAKKNKLAYIMSLCIGEIDVKKETIKITPETGEWRIFVEDQFVGEEEVTITYDPAIMEYKAEGELSTACIKDVKTGQKIYFALVVTDNYNRTYLVDVITYTKNEDESYSISYPEINWDDERWIQ